MTTTTNNETRIRVAADPHQSPAEQASLIARIAAAVAEDTGVDGVDVEVIQSDQVTVYGAAADRMLSAARWSA